MPYALFPRLVASSSPLWFSEAISGRNQLFYPVLLIALSQFMFTGPEAAFVPVCLAWVMEASAQARLMLQHQLSACHCS